MGFMGALHKLILFVATVLILFLGSVKLTDKVRTLPRGGWPNRRAPEDGRRG